MNSIRNLPLFIAVVLLSATTSFSQNTKPATVAKTRTEPQSSFRIQSIPKIFRGKPSRKNMYYIEAVNPLPDGTWYVALLMRIFVPPGKQYEERKISGVVAINVKNQKVLFLPSKLAHTSDGKAREIVGISPLSSDSCTLEVVESSWVAQLERKNFYEEAIAWKWTLPTGKFTRLGARMHVRDLAEALDRTPYNVMWPKSFQRDWDGKISIFGAGGKPKFSIQSVDASVKNKIKNYNVIGALIQRFPGDLDELWSYDRDFAPASDPHSLVVVHRRHYKDKSNKILLEGIRLSETPTVKWNLRVKAIGEVVKGTVRRVGLIYGVSRPCLQVPVKVESPEGTDWLCSLNTETGKLLKVHTFGEDSMFPVASPSGKRVAVHNGETDDKDENNKILIIDVETGKTKERVLTLPELGIDKSDDDFIWYLVTPLGFEQNETLILGDNYKLWTLPFPYTGKPRLVFSLPKSSKTPNKSKTSRPKKR